MSAMALVLESSVRALAIALAVGGVLALLRVRVAGVRHTVWVAVLGAMLLMPVLIVVLPAMPVPLTVPAPTAVSAWLPPMEQHADTMLVDGVQDSRPAAVLASTSSRVAATPLAPAAPEHRIPLSWSTVAGAVYGFGTAWFLLRIVVGWLGANRLLERSTLVFGVVRESCEVNVPVSVGLLRRRIILPHGWREWTEEQTNVVLAHERSHVERHDVLTSTLAALNRALFWFHPLAWWLERHLAAAAEHVADDVALKRARSHQAYAQMLIDIASNVQARGSRVSWLGVGIGGGSRLSSRIERVMRGGTASISRAQLWMAGVCCGAVIVLGVACQRRELPATQILAPDPEIAAEIEATRNDGELYREAWSLTTAQIAELETRWTQAPGDLALARKLLIAYQPTRAGKWVPQAPARVAARRELILWLIKNRPDHTLVRRFAFPPHSTNALPDPEGYRAARELWLAHLADAALPTRALSNAASFFSIDEPERSEQILLRAEKAEPGGGAWVEGNAHYSGTWSAELGSLYSDAIRRALKSGASNAPLLAFAQHGREVLDQSQDAKMLARAGDRLARISTDNALAILGFDPNARGKQYMERASAIDPSNIDVRRRLAGLSGGGVVPPSVRMRGTPTAAVDDLIAGRQYSIASQLLAAPYMHGEMISYYQSLPKESRYAQQFRGASPDESWARARAIADRILAAGARVRDDANVGAVMADAHQVLGLLALRGGDGQLATQHLLMSAEAQPSDQLRYTQRIFESRLTSTLLRNGVHAPVADYYDKMAKLGVAAEVNAKNAGAIRAGRMPKFFQLQLAREQQSLAWDTLPPPGKRP